MKKKLSGFTVPEMIQITSGIPKTISGKIMQRILRKVAAGETEDLGDLSTLAEPRVVKVLLDNNKRIIDKSKGL